MIFKVDFKSGKPVYLQLVDQIRYAAASGVLQPGEPLPSIRPLAEELRVNRNTIAKAYAELETRASLKRSRAKAVSSRKIIRRSPNPSARNCSLQKLTRPSSWRITCKWTARNF